MWWGVRPLHGCLERLVSRQADSGQFRQGALCVCISPMPLSTHSHGGERCVARFKPECMLVRPGPRLAHAESVHDDDGDAVPVSLRAMPTSRGQGHGGTTWELARQRKARLLVEEEEAGILELLRDSGACPRPGRILVSAPISMPACTFFTQEGTGERTQCGKPGEPRPSPSLCGWQSVRHCKARCKAWEPGSPHHHSGRPSTPPPAPRSSLFATTLAVVIRCGIFASLGETTGERLERVQVRGTTLVLKYNCGPGRRPGIANAQSQLAPHHHLEFRLPERVGESTWKMGGDGSRSRYPAFSLSETPSLPPPGQARRHPLSRDEPHEQ